MTESGRIEFLDPNDSLNLKKDGIYERFETGLVKRRLKPGQTFIDIGAHIGYYSALAASIVGTTGRVYAFEPSPANAEVLRRNMARFGDRVKIFEAAVTDRAGRATLYLNPTNSGDNRLFRTPAKDRQSVEVETVALDTLPDLRDVQADFIKIDIQGLEVKAIRGAAGLISRSPNLVGIVEFWPTGLKLVGMNPGDFLEALQGLGLLAYMKAAKRRLTPAKPRALKQVKYHTNLIIGRRPLL